jgi:alpha-glucosidase
MPDGWPCWANTNPDVPRAVTRWGGAGADDALARQLVALVCSLRGSVCLYQGEELGLTEAELAFEDLGDPYGIEFWPQFKGRDGCRTPMVWSSTAHLGAFSTAPRAWLPVPVDHLSRAVDLQEKDPSSILHFYRHAIAFRKEHKSLIKGSLELIDAPDTVLAFIRSDDSENLLCVFNMSETPVDFTLPSGMAPKNVDAPGSTAAPANGALSLGAFGAYIGELP